MAINVKDKLVTLESLGVAYSAEQDAREEADQALSTRIDNIVAPDGDPSLTEVSDARVSGSTTYNTLKARLDADKAAIGTEISQLSADLDDNVNDLKTTINNLEYNDTFVVLKSYMLEKGYYDNSGYKQNHNSRWRTINLFPMHTGDVLYTKNFVKGGNYPGLKIDIYDITKTHTSTIPWSSSFETYTLGYTFENDGYFALSMQVNGGTIEDFNDKISFTRLYINKNENTRNTEIFNKFDFGLVDRVFLSNGYWSNSGANQTYASNRVCNLRPIKVYAGDEIHPISKDILFDASNGQPFRGYYNAPFVVTYDGNLYFNIKNAEGSAISPDDYSGALIIKRKVNIGITETISASSLTNGYFDTTDSYKIKSASHRVVGFDGIRCKKGDHVRVNLDDIACYFVEFSDTDTFISRSTDGQNAKYYTKSTINMGGHMFIGDYIVQNDCWLKAQFYKISDTSGTMNPADYDGAYSVIHMADENTKISNGKYRFPLAPKKPRIIGQNLYREMQDGTVINGKLWIAMDGYDSNYWFSIVNLQTGVIEKTIPHTLGHCNALDYNANNDTLLITVGTNSALYLLSNPTGDEVSISDTDCLTLTFSADECVIASACWGEDNQTIYNMVGYVQSLGSTLNKCYKIILTMSNGEYTGTYTIQDTYDMNICVGVDTILGGNEVNYVQGACYDGYIYLGYGTRLMNYLVLDIDNNTKTLNVVGNLYYPLYAEDRTNQIMEPELIALNGNKIIIGSREWNDGRSFLAEFDR